MSYQLLSEPIRRYIREKGWEQLRPIQSAAIEKILSTDDNYILISRTASGKTEAAFLPILSKVNFSETGVQVLYISPLIALINDQFYRIEALCKNLEVTVTKWHGEANRTLKENLVRQPNGIVLITPESIEAMFVNKPYNTLQLFSNLKYVVIDEIHSFIGSDRGTQLKSILSRLQNVNTKPFSIIGLSATMSEENRFLEVKEFTGNADKTKVLIDRKGKEINASFRYFEKKSDDLPLELLKKLYVETKDNKVLVFPNSRGRAEEIAVKLKKISDKVNGHSNYFSHHSSVDREVREYVENFAKNNNRQNFCISCTSTLELGIDIGSVDEVVQIDATHSIASLIQRVGRSGRREGEISNLFLYATDEWSLLQSIACWLLYKEGFIETPYINEKPYDILLHQALSITKGHSGIDLTFLTDQLKENFAFSRIEISEIREILNHLIEIDCLEKLRNEVIIGVEGEKVVNNRDFYSVFKTEENFKVVNAGNTIGEVPFSSQIVEDQNILLAARIWKIRFVDQKTKKIEVLPAKDGKKPIFFGSIGQIDSRIREKILEVVFSEDNYDFLDEPSADILSKLRQEFSVFDIKDLKNERPLLKTEKGLQLFTFLGTKTNRTIELLLNSAGIKNSLDDKCSAFEFEIATTELNSKWYFLPHYLDKIDEYIRHLLETNPAILDFSKWALYLPASYQIRLLKASYFDFNKIEEKIMSIRLKENQKQPFIK